MRSHLRYYYRKVRMKFIRPHQGGGYPPILCSVSTSESTSARVL